MLLIQIKTCRTSKLVRHLAGKYSFTVSCCSFYCSVTHSVILCVCVCVCFFVMAITAGEGRLKQSVNPLYSNKSFLSVNWPQKSQA